MFSTLIVYSIISPAPLNPSPLSVIEAVLVTSIVDIASVRTSVESSSVFPSVSSPSSLISVTSSVPVGLLPVAVTVFEILPLSAANCSII